MEKKETSKRISIEFDLGSEKIYIYGDTIDELIEALKELKNASIILQFIKNFPNLSKVQNEELDKIILTIKDVSVIYNYFKKRIESENEINRTKEFEDAIIEGGNAEYIYHFARGVEGANISKLQDAIIASGNAEYIYYFARNLEGTDIWKLQDAIIASGNAEYIYHFARGVEGANISKLQDAIIASGNAEYIYYFARGVEGANISKLQDAIIASGNAKYICHFARDVEGANISKLQDAIIASGNSEYIYYFARNVEGVLRKVNKAIKETKNSELIREYRERIGKRFLF